MSLSAVRTALKTNLETISGLTVHKEQPDIIPKLPAAIIELASANYESTLGKASVDWVFRVSLLIADRDSQTAHTTLDGYLARTGSTSIKAAIESAAVGDFARVVRAENIGFGNYRSGVFVMAQFIVEVTDT